MMIRFVRPNDRLRLLRSGRTCLLQQSKTLRSPTGSFPTGSLEDHHKHKQHFFSNSQQFRLRNHNNTSRQVVQDFSSELIPLYPSFPSSLLGTANRIRGVRFFSNDANKPPSTTMKEGEETSASTITQESSSLTSQPTTPNKTTADVVGPVTKEETGSGGPTTRIQGLVDSVAGPTLKRVKEQINTGDLLSVYGIVTLIAIIIVAPMVVRQMRRSDNTYEDLDPEDPVMDMAKMVRQEFPGMFRGGDSGESANTSSSTHLGGLDSIVADLLKSPPIQQALSNLVQQILQSPEFKQTVQVLLKELWTDLVEDPETLKQVIHLLQYAIQDEQIKEAAIQLVTEVFTDKEVLDELVVLVERLGQEKQVQHATQALLVESAHNALNDPEILDHSMEFATDVVGDDVVQQTAGEALYNTLSYAVRPTLSVFLSMLGAGLIVLSVAAFRNASSPEPGALLLRTLESTDVRGISRLLSIPYEMLVSCKDAIAWVLLLPVRAVTGSLARVGRAGTATLDVLHRCILWIVHLPVQLVHSFLGRVADGLRRISGGLEQQSEQVWAALSASFLGALVRNLAETLGITTAAIQGALSSIRLFVASKFGVASMDRVVKSLFELLVQAYAKVTSAAGWVNARTSTIAGGLFVLEEVGDRTIRRVSNGYDHLNRVLESFAFLIEELLLSLRLGNNSSRRPRIG